MNEIQAMIQMAWIANKRGWQVTVVDPRPGNLPRLDRFPGAHQVIACAASEILRHIRLDCRTLVVAMSHNVALDAAFLRVLQEHPVRYIGLLGPRRRAERLLASLSSDLSPAPHCPVGLDIGADTPETIALSILAEMHAVLAGRGGGFLRDRDRPIHDLVPHIIPTAQLPSWVIRESVLCPLANSASAV